MKKISEFIKTMRYKGKTSEWCTFYTPAVGCFSYKVTAGFKGVNIKIAKTNESGKRGRPSKGDKIYNHDQACSFTLSPIECQKIINALPSILNGTYVDPTQTNEKYKNTFSIAHFPVKNEASVLKIAQSKTNSIFVSISPAKSSGKLYATYIIRPGEELSLFGNFINNAAKYLEFYQSGVSALLATISADIFTHNNSNSGEQQYNNKPQYDPSEPTFTAPPNTNPQFKEANLKSNPNATTTADITARDSYTEQELFNTTPPAPDTDLPF